jgi:hypothetical protein
LRLRTAKSLGLTCLAALFFSAGAEATEGFFTSLTDAPPAVTNAWNKTFAVVSNYPTRFQVGTASLVNKKPLASGTDLYFLTANHVIDPSCQANSVCPLITLTENLRLREFEEDGRMVGVLESGRGATGPHPVCVELPSGDWRSGF